MDADNSLLKQQLENALKHRKQLEDTYHQQFGLLSQFISRISLLCKGIDVELDNKMASLRNELQQNANLDRIHPLIAATLAHLQQMDVRQQQQVKQAQTSLSEAGKLLQKQRGLPNQLRRDLRELLAKVDEPAPHVQHVIPHITQLTHLYQTALAARDSQNLDAISAEDDEQRLCKQMSVDLLNLLSELAFEGKHAKAIEQIRLSLLSELCIERLLEACLKTIEVIISSINEERQSSQLFLLKLNDALSTVQQTLQNSSHASAVLQDKIQHLTLRIDQQISKLSSDSEQANSLPDLQRLVSQQLVAIAASLEERSLLEAQQRELLMGSVKDMELRLLQLEQDAQQFRQRLAEQKLRSLQDALTQLPNRAAFDERYELELKRWKRSGKPLTVVLADVDHFKRINDSYGHSAGDKTLRVIAKALKQSLRETDFIARYGGEEFVLLFPETSPNDLQIPLNNLREAIKRIPFRFKDENVPITISFGVTAVKSGDTPRSAFDRADEALYDAKHNGRDKVMFRL